MQQQYWPMGPGYDSKADYDMPCPTVQTGGEGNSNTSYGTTIIVDRLVFASTRDRTTDLGGWHSLSTNLHASRYTHGSRNGWRRHSYMHAGSNL